MEKIKRRDSPCYCINFRRATNALTKFYDRAFAPINLTASQFSLLNDIYALKSCNKSVLAQYAGLERTTIIRNLNVLQEKGFVTEGQGEDRRASIVQLTEAGKSALIDGTAEWNQVQKQMTSVIGEDNILILEKMFADIEALGDIEI